MSKRDDHEHERTPEEVDADVAKALAEAERARADARKADAEASHAEQEADKVAAEAALAHLKVVPAQIETAKLRDAERYRRAGDEHNHVYRFTDQVSAASVKKCMDKLTAWAVADGAPIELVFFSPGGLVFDGFALYDHVQLLIADGADITTGAVGYAASMGGVLLQAGKHRWIGSEGWVMIHRVKSAAIGQTFELEDEVEFLKRIEQRIIDIFVSKSGGKLSSRRITSKWKRQDWWVTANEALDLGLVDEIRGGTT